MLKTLNDTQDQRIRIKIILVDFYLFRWIGCFCITTVGIIYNYEEELRLIKYGIMEILKIH